MSNVKVQSSNEIQMSNVKKLFDICLPAGQVGILTFIKKPVGYRSALLSG
jgi:hypothetical protein